MGVIFEELKQRIVAIAANIRRYQERVDTSTQNRMFQNNQRQLYRESHESPSERIIEQPRIQESNSLQTNKYDLRVNILSKLDYCLGKMYKSGQN